MNYTFLTRAIFFVLFSLGLTLVVPPSAQAATFAMPTEYSHAGLTFNQPLSFTKPLPVPPHTQPITFTVTKKLTLSKMKQKRLEEIVVTPTIAKEDMPLPTPTVYIAPEITKAAPSLTPTPPQKLYTPVTLSPTVQPTTLPTAIVTQALQNPGGLNADKLFSMANAYRENKGLPPLEKDDRSCSLANSRAPEVNTEIAEGHMHSGLRARNLPYWNTENIISMNSEEAAFHWWINDTIHREAIEGNYKYSCVACSGNACAQEFTNFQAK